MPIKWGFRASKNKRLQDFRKAFHTHTHTHTHTYTHTHTPILHVVGLALRPIKAELLYITKVSIFRKSIQTNWLLWEREIESTLLLLLFRQVAPSRFYQNPFRDANDGGAQFCDAHRTLQLMRNEITVQCRTLLYTKWVIFSRITET